MRPRIETRLWQAPLDESEGYDPPSDAGSVNEATPYDFHHLSLALVGTGRMAERVLASRMPDGRMGYGAHVATVMELSSEASSLLKYGGCANRGVMMVRSSMGMGWILRSYLSDTGMVLYAHLHADPDGVQRLICHGAVPTDGIRILPEVTAHGQGGDGKPLSVKDEVTYAALSRAQYAVSRLQEGLLRTDDRRVVAVGEVEGAMAWLAALMGCAAHCTSPGQGRVSCYVPRLVEAVMMFWLCKAREMSPHRRLAYAVEPMAGADHPLVLRLKMPCMVTREEEQASVDELVKGWSFVHRICEVNGATLACTLGPAYTYDKTTHLRCRDLTVTAAFALDPFRELSGDLKAPILFRYDPDTLGL